MKEVNIVPWDVHTRLEAAPGRPASSMPMPLGGIWSNAKEISAYASSACETRGRAGHGFLHSKRCREDRETWLQEEQEKRARHATVPRPIEEDRADAPMTVVPRRRVSGTAYPEGVRQRPSGEDVM